MCTRFFFLSLLSFSCLTLTQCVDPYGNIIDPFAPPSAAGPASPYPMERDYDRSQSREQLRVMNQRAYERGQSEGRDDAEEGLRSQYSRHYRSYSPSTQQAYRDGYEQGFQTAYRNSPPSYPGSPYTPPGIPSYPGGGSSRPQRDPVYQQGYDYGLRDRVNGQPRDPDAHRGRYDPRFRRSFESGYYEAY
jgi:hypothetical protein